MPRRKATDLRGRSLALSSAEGVTDRTLSARTSLNPFLETTNLFSTRAVETPY
jgi:hypothetical protein